jgi:tetratricopeptide (TPR) repeat protein
MNNAYKYIFAAFFLISPLSSFSAPKDATIFTYAADEKEYTGSHNVKAMALYNLGSRLLYQGGDYAKAAGFLEEAVRLDETFVEALDNLSVCYRRLGKYDKAIKCSKESIAVFPNGEVAHCNLALIYSLLDQNKNALYEYKKVKDINPANAEAFYGTAVIYYEQNELTRAFLNATEAERLYRRTSNNLLGDAEELIGRICLKMGNTESAKEWSSRALKHKPDLDKELKKLLDGRSM